ncbi:MAG TPA: NAD(P)-dependent oxidoreductase [Baekduia sp.]|uniref:NAD-dependent epimerase/dehydratase family protein n=1 Tax=Baekduia sp. TaxID=2600305 RepID=UPI002C87AE42|nr:NAD(P)-dependent oxidoreductase [Baekduia sp.]HMJ32712.1 NAD(P)-dependent oxidoreductase [Baekduia sp.]
MRILVAGATGAIGRPLVDRLVADGHAVVGTTRREERARTLRERGAEAVVLDAFDAGALRAAVCAAEPEVVVHQLTALPQAPDPKSMAAAVALTGRLRRETVPAFLAAAREAGARRALVQSISFVTRPDGRPVHDEDAPLDLDRPAFRDSASTARELDAATLGVEGLEGVVLRYGFYYGPGTWYDKDGAMATMIRRRAYPIIGRGRGRMSFVHVDDAVDATVRALEHGAPGVYNVTDDEPATAREWLPEAARLLGARRPLWAPPLVARRLAGDAVVHYATTLPGNANARARAAFDWAPRPWRQGFAEVFA